MRCHGQANLGGAEDPKEKAWVRCRRGQSFELYGGVARDALVRPEKIARDEQFLFMTASGFRFWCHAAVGSMCIAGDAADEAICWCLEALLARENELHPLTRRLLAAQPSRANVFSPSLARSRFHATK